MCIVKGQIDYVWDKGSLKHFLFALYATWKHMRGLKSLWFKEIAELMNSLTYIKLQKKHPERHENNKQLQSSE